MWKRKVREKLAKKRQTNWLQNSLRISLGNEKATIKGQSTPYKQITLYLCGKQEINKENCENLRNMQIARNVCVCKTGHKYP